MGSHYIIALAPEAKVAAVPASKFPGGLPGISTDRLAVFLETLPFIHRDGLTFWGEKLEEFELDSPIVRSIWFDTHGGAADEVAEITAAFAKGFGPVTLIYALGGVFAEARAPMTAGEILMNLDNKLAVAAEGQNPQFSQVDKCPKCGRGRATRAHVCMYCGAKVQ